MVSRSVKDSNTLFIDGDVLWRGSSVRVFEPERVDNSFIILNRLWKINDNNAFGIVKIRIFESGQTMPIKVLHQNGSKKYDSEVTYHRLLLLREVKENKIFYMLSKNAQSTRSLFKLNDVHWLGARVAVFEPNCDKIIHGTFLIDSIHPLISLERDAMVMDKVAPIKTDLNNDTTMGFCEEVGKIQDSRINLMKSCGSLMCCGSHPVQADFPCASIKVDIHLRSVSFNLSTDESDIVNASHVSFSFAKLI